MVNLGNGILESDSAKLQWSASCPEQPIANIVLLHDLGEHAGCYTSLIDELNDGGIAVYAYDQRGNGKSSGLRGHLDRWDQHLADLSIVIRFVKEMEGDGPLFLFGHGQGALIAADFVVHYPLQVQGLIVNSLPLLPGTQSSNWMTHFSKLLGLVWPHHQINTHRHNPQLSQLYEGAQPIPDDSLIHSFMSIQASIEVASATTRMRASALEITTPVLITHGEKDLVNQAQGSREMFGLVASKDKTLTLYKDSAFAVHSGQEAVEYIADVCNWVLPRASQMSFLKMGTQDPVREEVEKPIISFAT
jgi:alpha-beta hydrolase superfamily lysophospholipase